MIKKRYVDLKRVVYHLDDRELLNLHKVEGRIVVEKKECGMLQAWFIAENQMAFLMSEVEPMPTEKYEDVPPENVQKKPKKGLKKHEIVQ